jgi:hypothetical protein
MYTTSRLEELSFDRMVCACVPIFSNTCSRPIYRFIHSSFFRHAKPNEAIVIGTRAHVHRALQSKSC